MITSTLWAGQTFGVYGLARTGKSVAAALAASGARVVAWDDGEAARAAFAGELTDLHTADLGGLAAMVVSPGVPHDAAVFRRAVAAGIPVVGDIELFAQARAGLPPHKVVGVTGTNGKSTTAALIHHILVTAGVPARLGGNIGAPILSEEPLPEGGVYVLELSSFQLELTFSLVSEVAVLLNITPDHLDRHGTMAAYAAAKARLFAMQVPADRAVIARDDAYCRAIADTAVARVIPVSAAERLDEGVSVVGGRLAIGGVDAGTQADWPTLAGLANAQNAACAVAAALALALGLERGPVVAALATYPGLPHRMERVREVAGVAYVNDSKATNPTSAAPALAAFPRVHWIAGGLAKTDDLDACLSALDHVRASYLIGDAAPLFARLLDGKVPVVMAGTLDRAVALAAAAAAPGDTVLLSPACASFDQFTDYAARGAAFREIVGALMKHLSRNDRTIVGQWFWTIDKPLLALVLLLIGLGVIAVAAASPAAAHRYSGGSVRVDDLYYLKRQVLWVLAGVPVMLGVSMLPVRWAKRVAIGGTVVFLGMLFAVPFAGSEVNGAVRWINLPGFQLQPSEFLKPLFVVATAWLLAARFDDRTLPTMPLSFGLLVVIAGLLVKQPDFGQTALFGAVWACQAILAGMSLLVIGGLGCLAVGGLGVAYLTSTHVAERIDHFVKGTGDTYQIDRALDCFKAGGLFGAGPGEGQMKFRLPEAHTDYIFSVIGEEFGAIACFMLAVLYLAIVVRVLLQLLDEEEPFIFLAASGLAIEFGLQAAINMAVNLALLPSKGMTLPFVSHGGSSFLALSMGMGLLLALTRRNPYLKASPYAAGVRAT